MKTWLVRFVSLYVFNVAVLLLIGLVLSPVQVGWSALWAGVILTAATIWLKPLVTRLFTGIASKSADQRTGAGEKLVQYGIVFVVELIVWILVVLTSGVNVRGLFWGWVIPPIMLLIAWIIYDLVDDKIEARTSALYDQAVSTVAGAKNAAPPAPETTDAPSRTIGRDELADGLTPEQRRMLDDLDNG